MTMEPSLYTFDENIPSFTYRGENSFKNHSCFIDAELGEVQAVKEVESIKLAGRSGRLHRTFGDYDSFEYPIEIQLTDFDHLEEVKRWLTGSGKLILSIDQDKYRYATVLDKGQPRPYFNEMNSFWKFTVTFECEPFKRTLRNEIRTINEGSYSIYDPGMVPSFPYFELQSKGGDIRIEVNGRSFVLNGTQKGMVILDCQKKIAIQNNQFVRTEGIFPYSENVDTYVNQTGVNLWKFSGIESSLMEARCLWL
ncbi:hypothetical protein RV10_GL002555 [Enterococcus pallens]|nr:hypothetical protein RV10_GL002555 [Enterococcus pallens]